jgi:DNA-binding NarL/FixJ family response regulator
VADDDLPYRRGVRQVLEQNNFSVSEAGDAASAIAAAPRLRPDICLIELGLPADGLLAIGRIAKSSPQTLIVVLSRSDRPEDVVNAFARGASGYLLKDAISGERLATTLRAAHAGEPAVSRVLVPYLVDEIRRGSERRLMLPDGPVLLTPREWEVGNLLREGHSTAEIAERLGVSPVTVRRYVGLVLQKLGVQSRRAAVELLRAYGRR